MSIARIKTFVAEVLTPADFNAELDNLATNILPAAAQSEVNTMTSTVTCLTPSHNKLVIGSETGTNSGTTKDFINIPSGTRRITVMFNGVSTSGTSDLMIQLGDSGGIETSGYLGSVASITGTSATSSTFTTGFVLNDTTAAASVMHGSVTLTLEDSTDFTWSCSGVTSLSNTAQVNMVAGIKPLSAELSSIRLTTVGGSDTFDAGAFNIIYER